MNAKTRFLPAMGGATAATFGIFFMMQGLATFDDISITERPRLRPIDINIGPIDPPTIREIARLTPPPPVEEEPVIDIPDTITGGDPLIISGPPVKPTPLGNDNDLLRPGFSDGEMVPIVRVLPQYPRRAIDRGIEGWVIVIFTVAADGTVQDARISDAEPKGIFDRAALKAIEKFKYKPTVIDGRALPTPNVQFRMKFELPSTD